jgi:hypothetical protein
VSSASELDLVAILEHPALVADRERGPGHGRRLDLHSLGMRKPVAF